MEHCVTPEIHGEEGAHGSEPRQLALLRAVTCLSAYQGEAMPYAQRIRVPSPNLPWGQEVINFALSYNGYDRHEGNQGAAAIANPLLASWRETGELDADLSQLRCALFFEQRRAHHTDQPPNPDYISALLAAIEHQSGGWVDGPADRYP